MRGLAMVMPAIVAERQGSVKAKIRLLSVEDRAVAANAPVFQCAVTFERKNTAQAGADSTGH